MQFILPFAFVCSCYLFHRLFRFVVAIHPYSLVSVCVALKDMEMSFGQCGLYCDHCRECHHSRSEACLALASIILMDRSIANMRICLFLEGHRRTWENQQISGHKVSACSHFDSEQLKQTNFYLFIRLYFFKKTIFLSVLTLRFYFWVMLSKRTEFVLSYYYFAVSLFSLTVLLVEYLELVDFDGL